MIERIISHYRIVEKLGEGGMGVVYKAEDTQLGRFVALKSLPAAHLADENRRARFLREARAASALNHPNIITIYDLIHEGNEVFLVMEFVDGKTLEQTIHARALPLGEALRIAVPIADALAAAHHAGITHRDLKPGNIMVAKSGVVKLLDFGLAKLKEKPAISSDDSTHTAAQHTEEGAIIGTISFMSPEQAQGKPVDHRSDIFSFGAVLYEMITGRRAFLGDNKISTLAAVLEKEPKSASEIIPNLPREVDRLIHRCLRKDPAKRWQTMADLKVALDELKEESDSNRLSGPMAAAAPPTPARRIGMWVGLGALAAAIAGGGWWMNSRPAAAVVAPLKKVDLTTYPGTEAAPDLSPDGSQVVFVWDGGQSGQFDVYVKLVDTGEPLRLTNSPESESSPKWSPDGRQIAFQRDNSIYAVPPLGGSERKIAEKSEVSRSGFDWSLDGKSLILADQNRLCLIELATGARKWITESESREQYDYNPRLSPDGKQVVFVRARSSQGQMDIMTVSLDGGDARPVVTEPGFNHNPIWIAGGQDILFNPQWSALFRAPASRGKAVRVPESDDSVMTAAYSHASHRLVYSKRIEDMNIWSLNTTKGAKPERLIAATRRDFSAQPSPQGDRLVFTSDRTGTWQIWTSAIDGSRQNQLTTFATSIVDGARWSPDSKQIVFSGLIQGNRDIYMIGAQGGAPKRLTTEASDEGRPWFSGDGKSIYFRSNRSGREEIWFMPAAGGAATQITRDGGFDVQESPDGALIYFTRGRAVAGLWRSRPDGSGAEAVGGMESCRGSLWAVSKAGIYFLVRDPEGAWTLSRRDLKKPTIEKILSIDAPVFQTAPVLSTTPDGSRVVWNQSDQSGADLVLIENFR